MILFVFQWKHDGTLSKHAQRQINIARFQSSKSSRNCWCGHLVYRWAILLYFVLASHFHHNYQQKAAFTPLYITWHRREPCSWQFLTDLNNVECWYNHHLIMYISYSYTVPTRKSENYNLAVPASHRRPGSPAALVKCSWAPAQPLTNKTSNHAPALSMQFGPFPLLHA